jgi:MFS family permease
VDKPQPARAHVSSRREYPQTLLGGLLALIVAMGIARFAYTPILPLMKNEAGVGDAFAGILASGNYLGYLAGALVAALPFWRPRRVLTIRTALVAASATTLAMGLVANPVAWLGIRFVSGVASAFVLVLVSSLILDQASREGRSWWPGVLYSGVGLGIALTGIVVPSLAHDGWRAAWIGLGFMSVLLCVAIWPGLSEEPADPSRPPDAAVDAPHPAIYWSLIVSYFAVGVGYIVPATFIVAILRATPQLASIASSSWIVVGLVAAPSPFVWGRLAARFGRIRMLGLAMLVLTAGVVAPVYVRNVAGATFAALALGGTFIGITTLVTIEARALFPHSSHRAIGQLTAAFGTGQVIGPLIVSAIATAGGSYDTALLAAASILLAGGAILAAGQFAGKRAGSSAG